MSESQAPDLLSASRQALMEIAILSFGGEPIRPNNAALVSLRAAIVKAEVEASAGPTLLEACRAVIEANSNGMTAAEAKRAIAMCKAAVQQAEGA